jgi:uncharacterized membrane protein YkoI
MKQSTYKNKWPGLACAAGAAAVLGLAGCSAFGGGQEALPATEIAKLQASGTILPLNRLNAAVIARHPGGTVEHAALDKASDDRFLYQASISDPNKMVWYVELDAKTGEAITDQQDPH